MKGLRAAPANRRCRGDPSNRLWNQPDLLILQTGMTCVVLPISILHPLSFYSLWELETHLAAIAPTGGAELSVM